MCRFRLEDGAWIDVNQTYKLCNVGKEREYFDTYCLQCYEKKKNKGDASVEVKDETREITVAKNTRENKESGANGNEQYLPWSEKNGGIQQTIALAPDLDMYLKLYCVYQNKKKNQLIDEIITEFKVKNPINL